MPATARRSILVGVAAVLAAVTVVVGRSADAAPVRQLAAACPAPTAPSAPDPTSRCTAAFARVDGIAGDSVAAGHVGEIDLAAVKFAVTSTGGTGRPTFSPFVVVKGVDRASVPLVQRAVTLQHIATVRVSVDLAVDGGSTTFLTYELTDVTVAAVRQARADGALTEEVEVAFGRITTRFVPRQPDGTPGAAITFCWDRTNNRAC